MIITLTTNPSLDRTLCLTRLRRGEVNRSLRSTLEPGGKGVNVSRALMAHGTQTTAVLPSGGPSGRLLSILLGEQGVPFVGVPIEGALRVNTAVVEPDGHHQAQRDRPAARRRRGVCPVGHGRRPAGGCRLAGCMRFARTGAALRLLRDRGAPRSGPAADDLVRAGIPAVIVTLGRDGALLVTGRAALHARAGAVRPVSTVGAGDSLLAGTLHALDEGTALAGALATGVRWGAAAVRLPGSQVASPTDLADVTVTSYHDDSLALAD